MNDLSLLEGRLPDDLPPAIRDWISPDKPLPFGVSHYPSYEPNPAFLHRMAALGLGGFGIFMMASFASQMMAGDLSTGHSVVVLIAVPAFLAAATFFWRKGNRAASHRRAFEQGLIRTGYFVDESTFLDFDGSRVWLVPHDLVQSIYVHRGAGGDGTMRAIVYQRGEETVRRRLEGINLLTRGLTSWHKHRRTPSGMGWRCGAPTGLASAPTSATR